VFSLIFCILFVSSSQPPVSIADGVDSSNEYVFTYDGGSESLNFTLHCTGGSCQHTFSVPNSSQVQQYTVSVAARNVVGVGTASAPVTIGMYVTDIIESVDSICRDSMDTQYMLIQKAVHPGLKLHEAIRTTH